MKREAVSYKEKYLQLLPHQISCSRKWCTGNPWEPCCNFCMFDRHKSILLTLSLSPVGPSINAVLNTFATFRLSNLRFSVILSCLVWLLIKIRSVIFLWAVKSSPDVNQTTTLRPLEKMDVKKCSSLSWDIQWDISVGWWPAFYTHHSSWWLHDFTYILGVKTIYLISLLTAERVAQNLWWWVKCCLCVSHHLPEDFGPLGSGERSVGHPAGHQSLGRISTCPLHLGHQGFLLFLEVKNTPIRVRKSKYGTSGKFLRGEEWVNMFVWSSSDPLLAAAQHQEGFNVVLLQVCVPLPSKSRFHIVVTIQILQCGLGDVDTPSHTTREWVLDTK